MELHDPFWTELAGRYRPERPLGAGGMAEVWLVHDERHGRLVALKLLGEHLASAMGQDRFKREIALLARLQHPNILPLIDSGENAGRMWYVTPFVAGESLRDLLTREGKLAIPEALRLCSELLDALGYAHRSGVVHRDIKPENVLLSEGHALLADFGIAREEGADRLTATGLSVGTPSYMSPEQVSGEGAGAPSDLYSMGCVLFECLTGQPPFAGTDARAVMAQHVMDPAPSLRARRPSVPEGVERVVLRALEKAPGDRWPDAAAFARALNEPATSKTDVVVSGARRAAPRRRRRVIAVAAVVVAVAASVGGVLLWRLSRRVTVGPDVALRQVTYRGDICSPSLSPDGRYATYIAGWRVWLADLERNRAWPVTDTINGAGCGRSFTARWSSDGRTFVFLRGDSAYEGNTSGAMAHVIGGARVLDSLGGPSGAITILNFSDTSAPPSLEVHRRGFPDRTFLLRGVTDAANFGERGNSPDGMLAYLLTVSGDTERLSIVDLASGRVAPTDLGWGALAGWWSGDSRALYLRPDSGTGLLRVGLDRRTLLPTRARTMLLPGLDTGAILAGVAVTRNRAAFEIRREANRIVVARLAPSGVRPRYTVADVATGSLNPVGLAATVTRQGALLFIARADTGQVLFEMPLRGGAPRRLASSQASHLRLSPDEVTALTVERLVRHGRTEGWQSNLVDLRTGTSRVLSAWRYGSGVLDCAPLDWDAAGRSVLAVDVNDDRTGWRVIRLNALSGGVDTLRADATGSAQCPAASPDGRWLATQFENGSERGILLLPLAGGDVRRFRYPNRETYPIGWLDSLHVVVMERPARPSDSSQVWVHDLAGRRSLLGSLPIWCGGVALSPGRSEITCVAGWNTRDLWIADDFDPYFRPPSTPSRRP